MSWMALTMPPLNFPSKQHSASLAIDLPIGGKAATMLSAFLSEHDDGDERVRAEARGLAVEAGRGHGQPVPRLHHLVHRPQRRREDHRLLRPRGVPRLQVRQQPQSVVKCFIVTLDIFPVKSTDML